MPGPLVAIMAVLATVATVPAATPAALAGTVPAPTDVCATADPRLAELSGLVAGPAWFAVVDGGRRIQIQELARDCSIRRTIGSSLDPYDVEDLAMAPDGTFWLADIGDNDRHRETVALIAVGPDGATRLHRLTYPDGPHDAEALLLGRDGVPVIVTKDPAGPAGVYRPDGRLGQPGPTRLRRAGEIGVPSSDTRGGPVGSVGARVVTGGAVSSDGRVVALRTYTDAWLYPAPDGDVVAALSGSPVQVPLPGEPQGEAIAFEPDGTLLSGSESRGGVIGKLRAVPRAASRVDLPPLGAEPAALGPTEPVQLDGWLTAAVVAAVIALVLPVLWRLRRRR